MKKRNLVDNVAFNVYIHALCKRGEFVRAVEELFVMESHKIQPDSRTYYSLLIAAQLNQDRAQIVQVLQLMEERGYRANDFVLHRLLDAYLAAGEHELAVDIIKQLRARGYSLTTETTLPLLKLLSQEDLSEEDRVHVDEAIRMCRPREH